MAKKAVSPTTLTRSQRKRLKKKLRKKREAITRSRIQESAPIQLEDVEIDYVADYSLDKSEEGAEEFGRIFKYFAKGGEEEDDTKANEAEEDADVHSDDTDSDDGKGEKPALSKKKLRELKRLTMAELKQLVDRPELVEFHDENSADPKTHIYLKGVKGGVAIPQHWNKRRKYLQGKRGSEKVRFQLPDFIAATGIAELRDVTGDSTKTLKQTQREKLNPKVGRLDLDYEKLHAAFFRYQTKPKLKAHGDVYYEGREYEVEVKNKRPGILSSELREALGMRSETSPPPWLINMQRYGPPPSYPHLIIPGLNAPIPSGAKWGFEQGGWGKLPLNEFGQPVYGNVFHTQQFGAHDEPAEPINRERWGDLEYVEEYEELDEEEILDREVDMIVNPSFESESPEQGSAAYSEEPENVMSGIESVTAGIETPDSVELELRKNVAGLETPEAPLNTSDQDRQLYREIASRPANIGQGLFSTDHVYEISSGEKQRWQQPLGENANPAPSGGQADMEIDASGNPENEPSIDESLSSEKYHGVAADEMGRSKLGMLGKKKEKRNSKKPLADFKF